MEPVWAETSATGPASVMMASLVLPVTSVRMKTSLEKSATKSVTVHMECVVKVQKVTGSVCVSRRTLGSAVTKRVPGAVTVAPPRTVKERETPPTVNVCPDTGGYSANAQVFAQRRIVTSTPSAPHRGQGSPASVSRTTRATAGSAYPETLALRTTEGVPSARPSVSSKDPTSPAASACLACPL